MPFLSKNDYKIFTFGKTYHVQDEYLPQLKNIDSYRYFIWSNRPYIWIPILIVSGVLSGVISYLFLDNFNHLKSLTVWLSIGMYLILSIAFYTKIRLIISEGML